MVSLPAPRCEVTSSVFPTIRTTVTASPRGSAPPVASRAGAVKRCPSTSAATSPTPPGGIGVVTSAGEPASELSRIALVPREPLTSRQLAQVTTYAVASAAGIATSRLRSPWKPNPNCAIRPQAPMAAESVARASGEKKGKWKAASPPDDACVAPWPVPSTP